MALGVDVDVGHVGGVLGGCVHVNMFGYAWGSMVRCK